MPRPLVTSSFRSLFLTSAVTAASSAACWAGAVERQEAMAVMASKKKIAAAYILGMAASRWSLKDKTLNGKGLKGL
jgi:hypothetical protein